MSTALESRDNAAILKATLGHNRFSFTLEVGKHLSVSDESLFYCMRCIEQSMGNLVGYGNNIGFKTSRVLPAYYENMTKKVCEVCEVLELMNPGLYDQLQDKLHSGLHTRNSVCSALRKVRNVIFEESISWEKIIALFAFTGSLVVECVQRGNSEFVVNILYSIKYFVESELVEWIEQHNGWIDMFEQFQSLDMTRDPPEPTGILDSLKLVYDRTLLKGLAVSHYYKERFSFRNLFYQKELN